jgi:hypothetical protein
LKIIHAFPLLLVASLLPLVGCSASQCDPTQADLFTGVGCAVSGYKQRTQTQQAELQSADVRNAEAQAADQNAQQNAAVAEDNLAQRRSELQRLERTTASLRHRVQAAQATQAVGGGALQQLNEQIVVLRRLQAENAGDPTPEQLAAIQARQVELANVLTQVGQ